LVALVPLAQNAKVRLESKIYLTMYLCLFAASIGLGTAILLYVWLLPIILGQPFLRLYLLAEHSRCPKVTNMLENTRTTLTNRLVRAIAWSMPYHTEHHTFPSVPFHRLPALHALLTPHLQVTSKGYLAFNKVYIQDEL
jgi:fatty acid desaturase